MVYVKTRYKICLGLLLPLLLLSVWWLVSHFAGLPRSLLPTPEDMFAALFRMIKSGQLPRDLGASLAAVCLGFVLAALPAVLLGAASARVACVRHLLSPLFSAVKQVPIIAWIPLILLWAGIGMPSKIAVIVLAAFFPIYMNAASAVASVPKEYSELSRLYGMGRVETLCKIYLPAALPQLLTGLRVGLAVAWMSLIAAELLSGTTGLGYRLSRSKSLLRGDEMAACILVIALTGFLLDRGIGVVRLIVLPRQRRLRT